MTVYFQFSSLPPQELMDMYGIVIDQNTLKGMCDDESALKDNTLMSYVTSYTVMEDDY